MNKLKEYAACLEESLSFLNERVAEWQRPTRTTNMGFSAKKCKSCHKFKACHECKGRKMTDTACSNYKPKKRRQTNER